MSTSPPPLAIVGIGCLFPKANHVGAYWANLKNGVDCITEVPATHWDPANYFDADPKKPDHTYARRGGFLDPYPFPPGDYGIAPNDLEATDTSQLLGLVAARMALDDCGMRNAECGLKDKAGALSPQSAIRNSQSRISVILGVTGTLELVVPLGARLGHPHWRRAMREAGVPEAQIDDAVQRIGESYVPWQEQSFPGLLGNVVAGRIANRLDLHGTNCVVDAACASSLSALHLASMELATGRADVVVTGGVDTFNDIFMYMCFSKTPALSPTGDSRPFSTSADGTILGEGLGIVVVKRLADAERDGDRVYAVIKGIGTSSDGKGNAIYAPSADGQRRCLLEAYAQAGVTPDTVELVEAHGTGTKVGDATEIAALTEVFSQSAIGNPQSAIAAPWCALGSVKSQIGHTKAAAGAAGLIKAALALYHKVLPPTIKVDKPAEALANSPFYVNTVKRPWLTRANHPRRAGVSAFGFGGSNFHVVLEEHQLVKHNVDWDGDVEIVALSANSQEELRQKVNSFRWHDWSALTRDASASRLAFAVDHQFRLLVVVAQNADVARLCKSAKQLLDQHGDEPFAATPDGIYYGRGRPAGKLGVLFPGQGSQYVGMLRDLACQFRPMQQVLEEANAAYVTRSPAEAASSARLSDFIYPPPVFSAVAANQEKDVRATHVAQPAIGAVSLGALQVLDSFGVQPEAAAGHSFGELTALCAAGCYDAASLHRLSRLRGQLMAEIREGDPGAMLAVHAAADAIESALAHERLELVIANRNSPQQVVLSGSSREIERAVKVLGGRQFRTTRLPVAAAFHSPLIAGAEAPFREALAKIRFQAAQLPVFANSSASEYPDEPDEIRALLAGQLARPVDFVAEISTMVKRGVQTFVEVGPGNTLTRLVEAILSVQQPGRQADAFALDASCGKRSGIVDLAHTLARIAARGHAVRLTAWNEHPPHPAPKIHNDKPGLVVPICGANYVKPRPKQPASQAAPLSAPAVEAGPKKTSSPSTANIRTISVSEPLKTPPSALSQVLQVTHEGLAAFQKLQEQTAQLHRQFLQSQEAAQSALARLVEQQQQVILASLNGSAPAIVLPPLPPVVAKAPELPPANLPSRVEATLASPEVARRLNHTDSVPAPVEMITKVLLDTVAEKTGYPAEMLDLDMGLDADLGIDSIKRVEILSALQERLPDAPAVKPEHLGTLNTLRQIVEFLGSEAACGTQESGDRIQESKDRSHGSEVRSQRSETRWERLDSEGVKVTLLAVVAEKTGYPVEMLELDMGLDADLGIDSIKRVEILSALQERLPNAPAVKPEHLGTLNTLRQIVEFLAGVAENSNVAAESSANGHPGGAPPPTESISRQRLRSVPLPFDEDRPAVAVAAGSTFWLVADRDSLADLIIHQLKSRSFQVQRFDWGELPQDPPTALGGLVLLPPSKDVHDEHLLRAFQWLRRCGPALRHGNSVFATVVRIDGRFGVDRWPHERSPLAGGFAGLAKTASHEWPEVSCKAVDVTSEEPAATAGLVVDELLRRGPVEIGISSGQRIGLELVAGEASSIDLKLLGRSDVVVISGGARGVTAEAALAFAETYQCTLVLLGRSPTPEDEPEWLAALTDEAAIKRELGARLNGGLSPREIGRRYQELAAQRELRANLGRLNATGAKVLYRSVDIRDRSAVQGVLEGIRRDVGPITGIIHGAGVIEDRRIEDKTDEQFDRVYTTKVEGLRNLLLATAADSLKVIALFSSSTARFGRVGQIDYAVANEVLNKVARQQAQHRPNCRVVSINWGPWEGGMVTPGLQKLFASEGIGLIPLREGARFLLSELSAQDRSIEVVAGVWSAPPSKPEEAAKANMAPAFERTVSVEECPVLADHVIDGKAVLPLALHLEWLAHAAMHGNPGLQFVGFDDVRVLHGIKLSGDESVTLRAFAAKAAKRDGTYHVAVELRGQNRDGNVVVFSRGICLLASGFPRGQAGLPKSTAGLSVSSSKAYQQWLFHGKMLQGITAIHGLNKDQILAAARSAPPPEEWMRQPLRPNWLLDPLAIDCVFQAMIPWGIEYHGVPNLPCAITRLRQFRRSFPTGECQIAGRITRPTNAIIRGDFEILDPAGELIVRIDGAEFVSDPNLSQAFRRNRLPVAAV